MSNPGTQLDVIIVGAGHNGLVAASYLARAGLRVQMLERRSVVGGLCATAEIIPGFRGNLVANSSHNLEPRVVTDMQLEAHGLRWRKAIEPSTFIMFPGGRKLIGWHDRVKLRDEIGKFSRSDRDAYPETLTEMSELGKALDVSFFEAPPRFGEVAMRLKTPAQERVFAKVMFGSAADVVNERLESEEMRTSLAMLAATGNFIGPSTPGSAYPLMQRPLYRGARVVRNRPKVAPTADFSNRAPLGGMGAITQAMERSVTAAGVEIRKEAEVAAIKCGSHGVQGVLLSSGEEIDAPIVISALNPKKTLLELVPAGVLEADFRAAVSRLDMRGCMGKVILALDGAPTFACAESDSENEILLRCGFRVGSTVDAMDQAYMQALRGEWSGEPVIYGLTQSAFDPSMTPPGKHIMSLTVSYAPYHLARDTWEAQRDPWAKHVIRALSEHIPNLEDLILDYHCLAPKDLEDEFGLLEGNALHGDVTVARMFTWRPIAGCSDYTTPVDGLYLCSNGTWPANYVSGLAGHNAAAKVIRDARDRRGDARSDRDAAPSEHEDAVAEIIRDKSGRRGTARSDRDTAPSEHEDASPLDAGIS